MIAPIRVEVERRLPVSVHDGFDYITDPANWPEHWPRLVRITSATRWREPRERACLFLRMLRREMELEVKLVRIEPYRLVEYTSEQRSLPAARHWRHLEGTSAAAGSTALSNPEEKRHFSRLLLLPPDDGPRLASAGLSPWTIRDSASPVEIGCCNC